MRIFIDTDVLLEVVLKREPDFDASSRLLHWAEFHPSSTAVSSHGLPDRRDLTKSGGKR